MINWAKVGDKWKFPDLCYIVSGKRFTANSMANRFFLLGKCFIIFASFKSKLSLSYLPTPPLGQDMTQGQFLSGI